MATGLWNGGLSEDRGGKLEQITIICDKKLFAKICRKNPYDELKNIIYFFRKNIRMGTPENLNFSLSLFSR